MGQQNLLGLTLCCAASLAFSACLRPAEDRVQLDGEVGKDTRHGLSLEVRHGHAAIREFEPGELVLWAQAPELTLDLEGEEGASEWSLRVRNCPSGTQASSATPGVVAVEQGAPPGECRFAVTLQEGPQTLRLRQPDGRDQTPYAFAVMSDVQDDIARVHEVFERMAEDPELRFVVSTGDLVNSGRKSELLAFQEELEALPLGFYSTVGNHEMGAPAQDWHRVFGPFNVHFEFKGVTFSLVDSGNATVDPTVYDWLSSWLDDAQDDVHIVLTHVPPLDPVGLRGGAFRSRREAGKFVSRLARGEVDALFLGHIHSYYAFGSAGVPTYISGGGGAIPERLDGIERHYLKVRVTPGVGIDDVALVRVD